MTDLPLKFLIDTPWSLFARSGVSSSAHAQPSSLADSCYFVEAVLQVTAISFTTPLYVRGEFRLSQVILYKWCTTTTCKVYYIRVRFRRSDFVSKRDPGCKLRNVGLIAT